MVRPIEIADLLSKTELIAKINQKLKANSEMEQRQAESILKKKTTAESEQAKAADKTDLVIINADKEKEKEKKKFKHNEEIEGEDSQDENGDQPPKHFDVKA